MTNVQGNILKSTGIIIIRKNRMNCDLNDYFCKNFKRCYQYRTYPYNLGKESYLMR